MGTKGNKGLEDARYLTTPTFINLFLFLSPIILFHGLSLAMLQLILRLAWNNCAQEIKVSESQQ